MLTKYDKTVVAVIGLILVVLTAIPADVAPTWVPSVAAVLTAISVYLVPNKID